MLNKRFLSVCSIFIYAIVFMYAADGELTKPSSKQIMLIGKVSLAKEINSDFYRQTLGIATYDAGKHEYGLVHQKSLKSKNAEALPPVLGDYFFMLLTVPKTDRFSLDGFRIYLFGDKSAWIFLPIGRDIQIPDDEQYLYLGNYTYSFAGDNFMVDDVVKTDAFDEAQELLNRKLGKKVQLVRAVLTEQKE